MIGDSEKEGT